MPMRHRVIFAALFGAALWLASAASARAQKLDPVDAEGQPLAANVKRLLQALEFLGTPLAAESAKTLQPAIANQDARKLQELLDPQVLFVVNVSPESRVKVKRGPAAATLQQGGYAP